MPGLDETLQKIAQYRARLQKLFALPGAPEEGRGKAGLGHRPSRPIETASFGTNPGDLRMLSFVPDRLPPNAPLVVVLHGCTQSAVDYDHGSGWSVLASRFGFSILFPEQRRANNPNLCFNWFVPEHTSRDKGEVASIRQMIDRMVNEHALDAKRICITGLSAGGAMTAAMLACYPELFDHGAIIAGLPYGAARNVQQALTAMFQGASKSAEEWGHVVRAASSHSGPWPKVSIWHGTADTTVRPSNAAESVKQWTALHGCSSKAPAVESGAGFIHRIWRGRDGTAGVELYDINGMAHGTPLGPDVGESDARCGIPGPYMLDVGVPSTYMIAQSWGLVGERIRYPFPAASTGTKSREMRKVAGISRGTKRIDPGAIIANALRAAGLMK